MKIWPDLPKLWAKDIREAGMTKNQARKVLSETEKTLNKSREVQETQSQNPTSPKLVSQILKKINIL